MITSKYNLIKEISEHYNLEEFFKTKLPSYKSHAALYTLFPKEIDAKIADAILELFRKRDHLTIFNKKRI